MKSEALRSVCQEVYRRFPEFSGVRPKVQASSNRAGSYTLTFQARAKVNGEKSINRWVRVVADDQGNISRMTTSR